jgi:hypothetical protein
LAQLEKLEPARKLARLMRSFTCNLKSFII